MRANKLVHPACLAAVVLSLALIAPRLAEKEVYDGQIGKQTFSAEMSRGFQRGDLWGLFPMRHTPEAYHPGPVPWAEEFPVYSGVVGVTSRILGVDLVRTGRAISFLCLIALLWGFFRLGRLWGRGGEIFVAAAACMPLFRIYGTSIMPDLAMAAACLWAWVFAWEKRWARAGVLGLLACLLKYYAVFWMGGIWLSRVLDDRRKANLRAATLWLAWVCAPTFAYLAYFLYLGVPNPITEYPKWQGGGHLGLAFLAQSGFYLRMVTWNLVKNPGLPIGLLAIAGAVWVARSKTVRLKRFVAAQAIAGLLFMALFSSAFFVHDYYGMQWGLLTATMAGWALGVLRAYKRGGLIVAACLVLGLGIGIERTVAATGWQGYYSVATTILTERTRKEDKGILVTDRAGETSVVQADRTAWIIRAKDWENPKSLYQVPIARLMTEREPKWLALMLVGTPEETDARYKAFFQPRLVISGWKRLEQIERWRPSSSKDWPATVWLLRRN